jgi:hypothetical protein
LIKAPGTSIIRIKSSSIGIIIIARSIIIINSAATIIKQHRHHHHLAAAAIYHSAGAATTRPPPAKISATTQSARTRITIKQRTLKPVATRRSHRGSVNIIVTTSSAVPSIHLPAQHKAHTITTAARHHSDEQRR